MRVKHLLYIGLEILFIYVCIDFSNHYDEGKSWIEILELIIIICGGMVKIFLFLYFIANISIYDFMNKKLF